MEREKKLSIVRLSINFFLITLISILVGCNRNDNFTNKIYCNDNEYWEFSNAEEGFRGIYYRFNKDHTSSRYTFENNSFLSSTTDSDNFFTKSEWYITPDSIMQWGMHNADIVKFDNNLIILYYPNDVYVVLVKVNKNNLLKGRGFFEQKRLKYPEKYLPAINLK